MIRRRQIKDEQEVTGEVVSEARLTTKFLKFVIGDCQYGTFSARNDPDYTVEQMEVGMTKLFVVGISRDDRTDKLWVAQPRPPAQADGSHNIGRVCFCGRGINGHLHERCLSKINDGKIRISRKV